MPAVPRTVTSTRGRLFRPSAGDLLYGAVVLVLAVATARVWWLSAIVPGMDYPQFLVFVRAAQDHADPSSPFYGTYSIGPWFMPTSLPVQLTRLLAFLCSRSIETAGRVLLTASNLGLVAASVYHLRSLGRPRWAVVLLFPLVHSRWTVVGGYVVYATSMTLVVLGWALAVRWLRSLNWRPGLALAVCLNATLLWHGIGFVVAGLGFATLWCLWRAPTWRIRVLGGLPTVPSFLHFVLWWSTTFGQGGGHSSAASWMPPLQAADSLVEYVWASVPNAIGSASLLAIVLVFGLIAGRTKVGCEGDSRAWRFGNPFLVVSLAYLVAYFVLPMQLNRVEGVANRFIYPAALAFVFAWNLPADRIARGVLLAAVIAFSAFFLRDLTERFRAFDDDTRGASVLMDRMGPYETLYCALAEQGASKYFAAGHKPLREIQQYATARHGGLPNSSFAGYGYNYVSYVDGRNPMPGLFGPARWGTDMTRFDYVLARRGEGPTDPRFRLVDRSDAWELYGVCGSRRLPLCS
jgi:hypothetical protein